MTDEHVISAQENALYEAMSAGDWQAVDDMRAEAYAADQTPPDTDPPIIDWTPPAQQFDADYSNAYAHYQADHEPHEDERVENRATEVKTENADAPETETE